MSVTLGAGKPSFEYDRTTWHFCSQKCRDKFAADPAHYLTGAHKKQAEQAPPAPAGTQYTCPMHPEIVRDAPGDCPKCGMALEPMGVPTGDEGANPDLVDFRRRLWIGAVLTVPMLVDVYKRQVNTWSPAACPRHPCHRAPRSIRRIASWR